MSEFRFEVLKRSRISRARVGRIHTPHGVIETPHFVPVGTNGVMKALTADQLDELSVGLIFCNTYHLVVQPGTEAIEAAGGLHSFMKRSAPIITDSGGFQVFSLAYGGVAAELKRQGGREARDGVVSLKESGVTFRSYRDGKLIELTPETSIGAQKKIGADIIVAFDELPPYHITPEKLKKSFDRTHRWELRSLAAHKSDPRRQALYAVIHGGIDRELRKKSALLLQEHDFDGFGIGGSIGKNHSEMVAMLTELAPYLPHERPVHLLGVGDIPAITAGIPMGIDTFDSSYPTKCARHGVLFTPTETVRIQRGVYSQDQSPIDPTCLCYTCRTYTRSYLHHLFKAHELTAYTLATIHNVSAMRDMMTRYRQAILDDLI